MRAPVTPGEPDRIESYVTQALAALDSVCHLDQLHAAYRKHTCATSPLALARRGIGELPESDRTEAAKRIAFGFARINAARWEAEKRADRMEPAITARPAGWRRLAGHPEAIAALIVGGLFILAGIVQWVIS